MRSDYFIRESAVRRRWIIEVDDGDDLEIQQEAGGSGVAPLSSRKRRRTNLEEIPRRYNGNVKGRFES